jgi:hypothetical protein
MRCELGEAANRTTDTQPGIGFAYLRWHQHRWPDYWTCSGHSWYCLWLWRNKR